MGAKIISGNCKRDLHGFFDPLKAAVCSFLGNKKTRGNLRGRIIHHDDEINVVINGWNPPILMLPKKLCRFIRPQLFPFVSPINIIKSHFLNLFVYPRFLNDPSFRKDHLTRSTRVLYYSIISCANDKLLF